MAMAHVTGTVNLRTKKVSPDLILVNRGLDDGVKWHIVPPNEDYAFVYVTFDKHANNFSNMRIAEDAAGRSTLQIDDSVANKGKIKYTLYYIKKSNPTVVKEIDPMIRNQ